jgi:hypothetical protein
MSLSQAGSSLLNELRQVVHSQESGKTTEILRLITAIAGSDLRTAKDLSAYRDLLLFLAAYPESEQQSVIVQDELRKLDKLVSEIIQNGSEAKAIAFSNSGFDSTYFIGSFSHSMCEWLLRSFPECTAFHSYGESAFIPQEILGLSLLPAENWLLENPDLPLDSWMKAAFASPQNSSLENVLMSAKFQGLPNAVRDLLYDSLNLFISFDIRGHENSAAGLRVPKGKLFYHSEALIKKPDSATILNSRLPSQLKLSHEERNEYLRVARFALLHLSRETDTVTYAKPEGLEVYDLGRGISIALFYLPPERRNALETYAGYMAFKNRIPCAYGGSWIFGNKAKTGLNIFPAFRGGESALLFLQIIRLYKLRFRVRYFEAEPYQIGKDNPEGINSGAFWFYYKHGFRPHQKELRDLAEREYHLISENNKYRSDKKTLRKLANSLMFLDTKNPCSSLTEDLPDHLAISKLISAHIAGAHYGGRLKALHFYEREIKASSGIMPSDFRKADEQNAYQSLLPLLYQRHLRKRFTMKDKPDLKRLIKAKAEVSEYNFTQELSKFLKAL